MAMNATIFAGASVPWDVSYMESPRSHLSAARPEFMHSKRVLSIGYWLKMVRIYAQLYAAQMIEHQAIGNFTLFKFISDPVRPIGSVINNYDPIPFYRFCALPNPARAKLGTMFRNWARFIYFFPEKGAVINTIKRARHSYIL